MACLLSVDKRLNVILYKQYTSTTDIYSPLFIHYSLSFFNFFFTLSTMYETLNAFPLLILFLLCVCLCPFQTEVNFNFISCIEISFISLFGFSLVPSTSLFVYARALNVDFMHIFYVHYSNVDFSPFLSLLPSTFSLYFSFSLVLSLPLCLSLSLVLSLSFSIPLYRFTATVSLQFWNAARIFHFLTSSIRRPLQMQCLSTEYYIRLAKFHITIEWHVRFEVRFWIHHGLHERSLLGLKSIKSNKLAASIQKLYHSFDVKWMSHTVYLLQTDGAVILISQIFGCHSRLFW